MYFQNHVLPATELWNAFLQIVKRKYYINAVFESCAKKAYRVHVSQFKAKSINPSLRHFNMNCCHFRYY